MRRLQHFRPSYKLSHSKIIIDREWGVIIPGRMQRICKTGNALLTVHNPKCIVGRWRFDL